MEEVEGNEMLKLYVVKYLVNDRKLKSVGQGPTANVIFMPEASMTMVSKGFGLNSRTWNITTLNDDDEENFGSNRATELRFVFIYDRSAHQDIIY